ncbi:MAG: hypothetical protein II938_02900 [Alphaproteobacteria bacterium]|nr:hypothetical protein [Alphaproteobacteria bacterium]
MTNNESGRSMVEMLGVLAIIGVLSIGGIAGYTQVMKKYKANELINAMNMTWIAFEEKGRPSDGVTYTDVYGDFPSSLSPCTEIGADYSGGRYRLYTESCDSGDGTFHDMAIESFNGKVGGETVELS